LYFNLEKSIETSKNKKNKQINKQKQTKRLSFIIHCSVSFFTNSVVFFLFFLNKQTNRMIESLLELELAYINTNHPDFVGLKVLSQPLSEGGNNRKLQPKIKLIAKKQTKKKKKKNNKRSKNNKRTNKQKIMSIPNLQRWKKDNIHPNKKSQVFSVLYLQVLHLLYVCCLLFIYLFICIYLFILFYFVIHLFISFYVSVFYFVRILFYSFFYILGASKSNNQANQSIGRGIFIFPQRQNANNIN
jgi:hypothetical protein